MKLRIKGNSIRMRLTRTEVKEFSEKGFIEDRTEFPQGILRYALRSHPALSELSASWDGSSVLLEVPASFAADWYASDEVGLQGIMELPGGKTLKLLLEKDFVCLDDTDEDQSDNYINPKANC
jgi:hypothetical protein